MSGFCRTGRSGVCLYPGIFDDHLAAMPAKENGQYSTWVMRETWWRTYLWNKKINLHRPPYINVLMNVVFDCSRNWKQKQVSNEFLHFYCNAITVCYARSLSVYALSSSAGSEHPAEEDKAFIELKVLVDFFFNSARAIFTVVIRQTTKTDECRSVNLKLTLVWYFHFTA